MTDHLPSTRTDAPAYLLRYLQRRQGAEAGSDAPARPTHAERGRPPYMEEVLARSRARAEEAKSREDAPPGGVTPDYAANTTSPREIVPPPKFFKERYGGAADVRLIRHGQTQGYATDAGLSPLGRWQAHRKGQSLARGVKPGMTIRFPHAPTARATETAVAVREGLLAAMARYGLEAEVLQPEPRKAFENFQVWCEGEEMDVTSAFMRYATILETYEEHKGGDRPGRMVEMQRFWNIQAAGGDPITHWLRMPMQYFEPAALCVRRFWKGVLEEVEEGPDQLRVFVCTHSGPIRAVATSAFGHDPGEPYNLEDVRMRVFGDREHAVVTYRERALEVEIPVVAPVSWSAGTTRA